MLKDGDYVYHEMGPQIGLEPLSEGEMHNGKMRFIFHLDDRFVRMAWFFIKSMHASS